MGHALPPKHDSDETNVQPNVLVPSLLEVLVLSPPSPNYRTETIPVRLLLTQYAGVYGYAENEE
jgi:hypothetical protein